MLDSQLLYEFGAFRLDPRERRVMRGDVPIALPPKAFDTLLLLVEHSGHLLTKDELMRHLWPDVIVEEANLAQHISAIRRALGDGTGEARYIETVPKRGYRFVAAVSRVPRAMPAGPGSGAERAVREPHLADVISRAAADSPPAAASGPPASGRFIYRRVVTLSVALVVGLAGFLAFEAGRRPRESSDAHAPSRRPVESVAVLPLRNLSNDASQEYFSDGMTDELITALAKVRQLRVISRTSVQRYRSTAKDLPEIARELKVDAVVEGSVARSGDRVRITAQLIDARSDTHLWADSYERDVRDVLVLQGEVAARIAAAVGITLSASEQARLRATPVVSPAAHEAYLRGNVYWNRFTCEGFQRALDYYTEAMTLAPGFAEAHAALADTHYTLEDWACSEPDGFAKARAAALRSVALQPELARAHAVLGEIAFAADWDWTNAEARLRRAVDLDPSDADIHATYAIYLMAMNRQAEGLHELTQALALAPVSEGTNVTVIYLFYLAHRFDEAIAQSRRTLELYPLSGAAYYWLGQAYERKGMNDEAAAAFLHPPDASLSPLLEDARQAHRKAGMRGYWRYQLARIAKQGPLQLCLSAPIYARLGERDRALAQLERDFESHCEDLRFLAVDPVFDGVRGDSRFQALLARMRLPTAGGPSGAARVADTGH